MYFHQLSNNTDAVNVFVFVKDKNQLKLYVVIHCNNVLMYNLNFNWILLLHMYILLTIEDMSNQKFTSKQNCFFSFINVCGNLE